VESGTKSRACSSVTTVADHRDFAESSPHGRLPTAPYRNSRRFLTARKPFSTLGFFEKWCGRVDSNHHALASASPSSWCVCQFRHDRLGEMSQEIVAEAVTSGERSSAREPARRVRTGRARCLEQAPHSAAAQISVAPKIASARGSIRCWCPDRAYA
jgi:hypothetical protein